MNFDIELICRPENCTKKDDSLCCKDVSSVIDCEDGDENKKNSKFFRFLDRTGKVLVVIALIDLLIFLLILVIEDAFKDSVEFDNKLYQLTGNVVSALGLLVAVSTGGKNSKRRWEINGYAMMMLSLLLAALYISIGIYAVCNLCPLTRNITGIDLLNLIANMVGIIGICISLWQFSHNKNVGKLYQIEVSFEEMQTEIKS